MTDKNEKHGGIDLRKLSNCAEKHTQNIAKISLKKRCSNTVKILSKQGLSTELSTI